MTMLKMIINDFIRVNSELLNHHTTFKHGWKSVDEFQKTMLKKPHLGAVKIPNGIRANHIIDSLYQEITFEVQA